MDARDSRRALSGAALSAPLVLFLGVVLVIPLARLGSLASVASFDHLALVALRNSLALSALVAVVSVVLCIVPAWVLARWNIRGKRAIRAALALPMAFSGVVVGFLAILMIGRAGVLPLNLAYGFCGLVIAYLYFEIPRATLALESVFREIDASLEAAAATLGARPFTRITRLILPMTAPSIVSVLLLTFSVSLGSYGVALLISRRYSLLPVEIYAAFTGSLDDARAATLSVVLVGIALVVGFLCHPARRRGIPRSAAAGFRADSAARNDTFGTLAPLLLAAIAIAPPLVAIAQATHVSDYAYVLRNYGDALLFSLKLAIGVVVATLVIAVPAAYAFVRHPFRGSAVLERIAVVPLSLPGVTVAIALITASGALRGSVVVLAAGQMLYTTAYVVAVMTSALRNIALDDLDDAARTLGARRFERVRRIILPLLVHPIVVAALIAFAISWGEFNVSYLLATPLTMPFAAALYGTYVSNSPAICGAATAIFVAGALPFLAAIQLVDRRTLEFGEAV